MDVTTLMICIVSLLVGLVVGSLLTKTLSPQEKKRRELEEKLQKAEAAHKAYQQDVTDHFIKTADMLGQMTQSYRSLGEHLAGGAMTLATADTSRKVLEASAPQLPGRQQKGATLNAINAEPPKDYAPSVPGGVLSENYGFGDEDAPEQTGLYTKPVPANPIVDSDNDDDDDPTLKVG